VKRVAVLLGLLMVACSSGSGSSSTTTVAPHGLAALASVTTTTTLVPVAPPADMLNPDVTQATIASTICKRGWTATIRPPVAYTEALKRLGIRTYGYADKRLSGYEEDHSVPLILGGSPTNRTNLWPEPHKLSVPDDGIEVSLGRAVCAGRMSLAEAQARIYTVKLAHGFNRDLSSR
jgi:hypothetical protein